MVEKVKTHDFKGEIYVKIPSEIAEKLSIKPGGEIEFSIEKDKVILKSEAEELSSEELRILKKLGALKHYERTAEKVTEMLEGTEPNTFKQMLKKRILFEYEKQGNKLIGIDRNYFHYVFEKKDIISELFSKGWLVIDNPEEASELNKKLTESGKSTKARGIKGFDKKYYVVANEKIAEVEEKILNSLETEKLVKEVCDETGEPEELCRAVIEIMKEDGDVMEKTMDKFKRI